MNPYLVGCEMWEDIVKRWDKGQHGNDWEEMENHELKLEYDDGSMKGREKMFKILRTSSDWMFMNNFLTNDLVRKLKLYMYVKQINPFIEELVITDKTANEVKDILTRSFSHSGVPRIFIDNGNYLDRGELYLKHEHIGANLHPEYAQKTLEHIEFLWNEKITLETTIDKKEFKYVANKSVNVLSFDDTEYLPSTEL
jgi:stage V sporulation protein R